MDARKQAGAGHERRALFLSTLAFGVCFAIWTIFSIIGIELKQTLDLNETEFGLLLGIPILSGSLARFFLGIWTEQYGARMVYSSVMLVSAVATWSLTQASTYEGLLLCGLGLGLAGGTFAAGLAYLSSWYPAERQGSALGMFGFGNIGAAVTLLVAPFVVVGFGWEAVAYIWAVVIAVTAVVFWFAAEDDPALKARRLAKAEAPSFTQQTEPLRKLQVWRFSLYYFFVFGGFVALALWLPYYYMGAYELDLRTAGVLSALFAISVSIFRVVGSWLSEKYGARRVMYWTFGVSILITFLLSYPPTDYVVHGIRGDTHFSFSIGVVGFSLLTVLLGIFMSFGMAAVYRHIPEHYPENVGSVGGVVGMVGGLGGFFLPIAFGILNDVIGLWTGSFMLLFVLVSVAMGWMHSAIRRLEMQTVPELRDVSQALPELIEPDLVLHEWEPEDKAFWEKTGKRIAQRNLWISIPALFLAFAVWMVWSVVVVNLPRIGFSFSTNELFWLAAIPGLSGATLRIFYSFMVPIFGGRRWTAISTASLLLPALGIGLAVQNPETPYLVMLILAFLCGFGGGNFASSMANISFFYPQAQKGTALGMNAGLGNLGVSGVQFIVPLVITAGVFGALGGEPQAVAGGEAPLWLQNAGFIWVPFIVAATIAAWYGMNDIESAKASFKDQSVIFKRKHNWLMCWLYTGTFGSFIGYSAGLPLLIKTQFPGVDATKYAFLGPLVGALIRPVGGWLADKLGGARVTFWNFIVMSIAVTGVLHFLPNEGSSGSFAGFLTMFIVLFSTTGIGNGSTFRMIPVIFRTEREREAAATGGRSPEQVKKDAAKESAAVLGFSSAIAAYGAFFVPKSYGTSINLTGSVDGALYLFLGFYVTCVLMTWWYYSRKGAEMPC